MRAAICVVLAWTAAHAPAPDAATGVVKGRLMLGDTGAAAAHVTLRLLNRGGTMAARTDTGDGGEFRFSVRPGVYRLSVQLAGDQTQYLPGTLGAEGTLEEGDVFRVRAGTERLFDYGLKASGALGGRVLDPDGKPLKDGTASVDADPGDNGGAQILTHGTASTDAEGRFLISGLAPGMYRVSVLPPERQQPDADGRVMLPTYYPGRIRPQDAEAIAVGAGDRFNSLTLTIMRGMTRSVSGRIIDPDGSPAANRTATFGQRTPRNASSAVIRTDEEGRFTARGLIAGHYECITVGRSSSDEWGFVSVDLGLEDVQDIVVQIRPPAHLTGHVVFEEKEHPVPDARVWTSNLAFGPASKYADVKPDGGFDLILNAARQILVDRVPDGWHVKAIWINGVNALNTTVEPQSARSPVTIVLGHRIAGLTGHVEDAGETDAVLAIADDPSTWTPGSSQLAVAELNEQGDFRFDGLLPGNYRLAVAPHIPSSFHEPDERLLSSLSASGVPVRLVDGEIQQLTLKAPGAGR